MGRECILVMITVSGVVCPLTLADPQKDKPAEPRTYHVTLWLPRFDGRMIDGQWSPSFEEVKAVLKGLPCLPQSATVYGDNSGRRVVQFPLLPKADCDLGDVAKALGKLGGDKNKPVAVVSLAKALPVTEEQSATIKKELAAAKGIDWKNSGQWNGKGTPQASGFLGELALDEAGGAKFLEIRAAYKRTGITLRDGVDDK